MNSHLKLVFDGSGLILSNIKFLKGGTELFRAYSGNGHSEAIPTGSYWIETQEIHKMKVTDDWTPRGFSKPTLIAREILEGRIVGAVPQAMMLHMSAWGPYRIPIRQSSAQEKSTGRKNMFIHGGDSPGSAGCIDLVDQMEIFVSYLKKEHPNEARRIDVIVVSKTRAV